METRLIIIETSMIEPSPQGFLRAIAFFFFAAPIVLDSYYSHTDPIDFENHIGVFTNHTGQPNHTDIILVCAESVRKQRVDFSKSLLARPSYYSLV